MNPEPKKDGRATMRLLVKGFMEPKEWDTIKDSPTALASTVKTLVAMGLLPDDTALDDVISIGDISTAFLFAKEYGPDDMPRYVGYKAHKHASLRIFQLLGPLYGQRDASHRWWETLSEWLIKVGFERSENDKCAFYHPHPEMLVQLVEAKGDIVNDLIQAIDNDIVDDLLKVIDGNPSHDNVVTGQGFRLACHVDDIITRGHIAHTKAFWKLVEAQYALKSWDVVDFDNPLVYTGVTISKHKYDGCEWYHMDQSSDIRDFLEQYHMWQVRPVTAPMPTKTELYSDLTPLSHQEHKQ